MLDAQTGTELAEGQTSAQNGEANHFCVLSCAVLLVHMP